MSGRARLRLLNTTGMLCSRRVEHHGQCYTGGGGGGGGGSISGVGGICKVSGDGVDGVVLDGCVSGVRPPCCLSSSLRRVCPAQRPLCTRKPPRFRSSRPLPRTLTTAPGCTERPGGSYLVVRGVW